MSRRWYFYLTMVYTSCQINICRPDVLMSMIAASLVAATRFLEMRDASFRARSDTSLVRDCRPSGALRSLSRSTGWKKKVSLYLLREDPLLDRVLPCRRTTREPPKRANSAHNYEIANLGISSRLNRRLSFCSRTRCTITMRNDVVRNITSTKTDNC